MKPMWRISVINFDGQNERISNKVVWGLKKQKQKLISPSLKRQTKAF